MAEAREFVVACWRCRGTAVAQVLDAKAKEILSMTTIPVALLCVDATCGTCNGTGLIRIRALPADIPTIERVPEDV